MERSIRRWGLYRLGQCAAPVKHSALSVTAPFRVSRRLVECGGAFLTLYGGRVHRDPLCWLLPPLPWPPALGMPWKGHHYTRQLATGQPSTAQGGWEVPTSLPYWCLGMLANSCGAMRDAGLYPVTALSWTKGAARHANARPPVVGWEQNDKADT